MIYLRTIGMAWRRLTIQKLAEQEKSQNMAYKRQAACRSTNTEPTNNYDKM